ncbi:MAG: hypothetical protein LBJ82_00085, partial [Deltaproteobacteria bacterium]|nr:hypothetical protein [Deltaproteobacteria bacterium]
YAEASGRVGGVHNEYSSSDLRDPTGRKADYDSSSAYYGLHFGGGYLWNINEKAPLDFYGKYFWTRQEGDSVTLSTGDPVTFKDYALLQEILPPDKSIRRNFMRKLSKRESEVLALLMPGFLRFELLEIFEQLQRGLTLNQKKPF